MNPRDPYPGHSAIEVLDAWEAVQERRAAPPGYLERWRQAKFSHALAAVLILGLLPWAILFFGFLALGVWDHLS